MAARGVTKRHRSAIKMARPVVAANSALAKEVARLKRQVALLEDERQIRDTLHRYSLTIDYGPPPDWANVFTEDGVFDVYMVNQRKIHKENGRGDLRRYLATKKLPPIAYDKHLICSPVISIKGKTARVEAYVVTLRDEAPGGPRVSAWGRYYDTFEKQSDGRWLIKERRAEMEAVSRDPFRRRD